MHSRSIDSPSTFSSIVNAASIPGFHGIFAEHARTECVDRADERRRECVADRFEARGLGPAPAAARSAPETRSAIFRLSALAALSVYVSATTSPTGTPRIRSADVPLHEDLRLPRPGVRGHGKVPVEVEGAFLMGSESHGGRRLFTFAEGRRIRPPLVDARRPRCVYTTWFPARRRRASSYLCAVVRMTSSGRRGAGGFLSHRIERR